MVTKAAKEPVCPLSPTNFFQIFKKNRLIKLMALVKIKLTILVKGVDGDEID
jgi:hypothetical protein